jgi:hypothetical protein
MRSYDNAAAITAAPSNAFLDPVLRHLLAERVQDWTVTDLLDLTHVLVVESGDSEADIVREVAFSPLSNSIDGRFGSPEFQGPQFDWIERHDGWFELIQTFQDGFAFVLFVEVAPGTNPELLDLCREYAAERAESGAAGEPA